MALYTVATNGPTGANDLNQVIALLSGTSSPVDSRMIVANRVSAQLTGATATSGLAGSTVNGPPTSGTFALGDLVVDTGYGCLWVCTTAGSPGSWTRIGGQTWLTTVYISPGNPLVGPVDTNGNPLYPAPASVAQTFFTRSGRTGFDVLQCNYLAPYLFPYQIPGFSGSAYGVFVPIAGTYLLRAFMDPTGPTVGTDLGIMVLKNGVVYQYGTEFLSYGSPEHRVFAVVHCAANDLLQVGAYSEGQYSPTSSPFSGGFQITWLGN